MLLESSNYFLLAQALYVLAAFVVLLSKSFTNSFGKVEPKKSSDVSRPSPPSNDSDGEDDKKKKDKEEKVKTPEEVQKEELTKLAKNYGIMAVWYFGIFCGLAVGFYFGYSFGCSEAFAKEGWQTFWQRYYKRNRLNSSDGKVEASQGEAVDFYRNKKPCIISESLRQKVGVTEKGTYVINKATDSRIFIESDGTKPIIKDHGDYGRVLERGNIASDIDPRILEERRRLEREESMRQARGTPQPNPAREASASTSFNVTTHAGVTTVTGSTRHITEQDGSVTYYGPAGERINIGPHGISARGAAGQQVNIGPHGISARGAAGQQVNIGRGQPTNQPNNS